jgi:hypothetical protein
MGKGVFSVWLVTVYLIGYSIIAFLEISVKLVFILFSLSPILVIWMVISVLKSKNVSPKALKDGEEWGYLDISKKDLNTF